MGRAAELDSIIRQCLASLKQDIQDNKWVGRENEVVSLFAFGHLLNHVEKNSILYDPAQIEIESAVPQTEGGGKKQVRKDLIIWPKPGMTCWNSKKIPENFPLAIIEWKLNGFRTPNNSKLENYPPDVEWLKNFSKKVENFEGYAVTVDITKSNCRIVYTRVHEGKKETPIML